MAFGRKNHVKVDPTAYSVMLLGEPKIGKTTVMKEALELLVGENYKFVELGREKGADAIEGINCINCPEWNMDYDEDINAVGWYDLVDDACDNPSDYEKIWVMDTFDQFINIAEDESLRLFNKENPDKRAKTLNAAWGGFGAGQKKAIELMFSSIDRLNAVGIKVWWIGHVRNKSVTDITTGETYEVLSSDQQQNYFNALKKNLHFLGLAYIDREIVKEKTGKKNVVTKKDEEKSVIKEESRKIRFRDNSYSVDCGSRFKNITDCIDLDAEQFINAMKDAIRAEIEGSDFSEADREKAEKKAEAVRMKEIAEAEEKNKAKKEVDAVIEKIMDWIKDNKSDMTKVKPVLSKCKEFGAAKPTDLEKLEDALAVLELIEE